MGKLKCAFVLKKWERLIEYTSDSSVQYIRNGFYEDDDETAIRVYKTVGEAILRSPHLEDSILTIIERKSDDRGLVSGVRYMKLVSNQTLPEDQRSLLFYILNYPLPEDFKKEKDDIVSRFNFFRQFKDDRKLDNLNERKSPADLIKILECME
ncbi:MAG: hypothetical protein JW863_14030 [Chitinispirillaceae bacterium]|nr:hypothetical protein [Chitinispirillaceae bacterium]